MRWVYLLLLFPFVAYSVPLEDYSTVAGGANSNLTVQMQPNSLWLRGTDDKLYLMEVDQTTGAMPVSIVGSLPITQAALEIKDSIVLDYSSTNVTTGAWVELIASTADDATLLTIDETNGQFFEIGFGAAASETRAALVAPGGIAPLNLNVPSGTRISIRAIESTADVGRLGLALYGEP